MTRTTEPSRSRELIRKLRHRLKTKRRDIGGPEGGPKEMNVRLTAANIGLAQPDAPLLGNPE